MLQLSEVTYAPATVASPVLRGVSFRAERGKPLLIAGSSGSGKTSLLEGDQWLIGRTIWFYFLARTSDVSSATTGALRNGVSVP
jgi:ABC-type lipoprotein export system ATPase subunit